ncbi:TadE/TadG family protein [Tardiphaga sp. vice352]|uniref:TadE/TadG family type IV pilus assembly protein n=1 Tax=Tardiphaga sp. vice352 TaxID=2592816 RepID=UPI001164F94B|nr:pilus assembly protein [Tardiphaga sp. vice352]QDM32913.1 TadE/TadG family protein [Tardiphaga sp. vice352]
MSNRSTSRLARNFLQRFLPAEGGNVAVMFAIVLAPLLGFVGAAVDYTRASSARSSMQVALDSAALMVSKDLAVTPSMTAADITAKASVYFNALYTNPNAPAITVSAVYTPNTGKGATVQVSGAGSVPTEFMNVVGFPRLAINSSSTTTWGNARMRVAMALDNTGSMNQDGKLPALKTAAKSLVDQLSALSKTNGDVYISVVPFAKDVDMGASNYNASWIDWTDWEAEAPDLNTSAKKPSNWSQIGPGSSCPWSMNYDGFTCMASGTSTSVVSSIPSSGLICPGADRSSYQYAYHYLINGCYTSVASSTTVTVSSGYYASCNGFSSACTCSGNNNSKVCKQPTYTHVWTPNNRNTWSGCIADRTQDYDTKNSAPVTGTTASLFPAEQYYENQDSYCAPGNSPLLQTVTPLSYDWSTLKSGIDAMQGTGGTNQPIGMALAWQSLGQTAPFNAPAEEVNYTYVKAIILLSDGLNTENRWPEYGNGSSQTGTMIDDRQKTLCDNIKAAGVTIYTIQVNTGSPADPTSSVLQYCASNSGNFYLVTAASQTVTAFNSIYNSLSQLRVAK